MCRQFTAFFKHGNSAGRRANAPPVRQQPGASQANLVSAHEAGPQLVLASVKTTFVLYPNHGDLVELPRVGEGMAHNWKSGKKKRLL